MKEHKSIAPVLGVTMLAVARSASDFRTLFIVLINDNITQSKLRMIWFMHGKLNLPSGLVSRFFNHYQSTFSRLEARKRKSLVVRDIVSVSPNFCSTYKG